MSSLKAVALFLLALWLPGCGRALVEFEVEPPAAPTITSTLPARDATGVALDTSVAANFSQRMSGTTVNDRTFTLRQGTTQVAGAVSLDAGQDTATFRPSAPLSPDLIYTAIVSAGVLDTRGRALAANYVWSFTTISAVVMDDLPTVTATAPASDAVGVAVNIRPSATFSEAMDAATLNAATFTLRQGTTSIAGSVSLNAAADQATFTPEAALGPGLVYTAAITTAAHDSAGQGLATRYEWSFTTTTAVVGDPPTVTATTPAPGAALVPVATVISATFSSPMDPATINDTTFTLTQVATRIEGSVSYDVATRIATFTLDSPPLVGGLTYTASISTLVTDSAGLPLEATYTWAFGTAPAIVINAPPTVSSTDPELSEDLVAVNSTIAATFSEPMDQATITDVTFTLSEGGNDVPAGVLYDVATATATLTPDEDLDFGLTYTASISTVVTDLAGTAMEEIYTWTFSTAPEIIVDDPPTVSSTDPELNEGFVAVNATVAATFSEPMAQATITDVTFTLSEGGNDVPASVLYDVGTTTATLTPDDDLDFGLIYTASISTVVTDAAGTALEETFTWSFTTVPEVIVDVPPTVSSTDPGSNELLVAINTTVAATFSEPMAQGTITDLTFTLTEDGNGVPASVLYDAGTATATLTPDDDLDFGLTYTASISTVVTDAAGTPLVVAYTWTFSTIGDLVPPSVVSKLPDDGDVDVSVDTNVTVTFNERMAGLSLNGTTFTLLDDVTVIDGDVSLDGPGTTATFNPDVALDFDTVYTATISGLVTDAAGNALVVPVTWDFTTGPDNDPPGVASTVPIDGALLVPVADPISVTFDEEMATASIGDLSFTVLTEGNPVDGTVSLDGPGTTATFEPDLPLSFDSQYTATINTLATDLEGNALAIAFSWSFTTVPDPNPPVVSSNLPLNLATEVSINTRPKAIFNRGMDVTTIGTDSFLLAQGLDSVDGVVTYDPVSNTATFDPDAPLGLNLEYTATITTLATAVGGTPLVTNFSWTFTTAACSQEPVELGNAGHFAVLAGSTVTSTGLTDITGDLGVSPGTEVTGFGPGTVDGAQEAGTPAAADGIFDLTTAFNDARDRVLCPVSKSGNLGGQTLPPGLYKSDTSMAISSGDLTLDGLGDPDAVFIFQMASTLTTTAGRAVVLINGANPANIIWQVGSSATLGTTSAFFGTIMADQAVTLETGASLEGRALARIAAVALDGNVIQLP